jgi:hypothetical protein
VTVIETITAGVTVRDVEPEMSPDVAVMMVEPAPVAVANPLEPSALLITAMEVTDELQITDVVIS